MGPGYDERDYRGPHRTGVPRYMRLDEREFCVPLLAQAVKSTNDCNDISPTNLPPPILTYSFDHTTDTALGLFYHWYHTNKLPDAAQDMRCPKHIVELWIFARYWGLEKLQDMLVDSMSYHFRDKKNFDGEDFIALVKNLVRECEDGNKDAHESLWMLARWAFVRSGGRQRHVDPVRAFQQEMREAYNKLDFGEEEHADMTANDYPNKLYFHIKESKARVEKCARVSIVEGHQ
jgi:hypothetical protein